MSYAVTTEAHPNRLRATLSSGGTAVGLACHTGDPHVAETLALAGFDYLYLDQQHSVGGLASPVEMVRATARTGTTALVRVAANDPVLIGRALDAGAEGVIVPNVESAEDARRAAAAAHYPPDGVRSWGPTRSAHGLGSDPATVNGQVLCLVMIETAEGVARAKEITAVPGVHGVYVGPGDLAVSLGLDPVTGPQDQRHRAAVAEICEACATAGIAAGITGDPVAEAGRGFRMVTAGSDVAFLKAGLTAARARRDALTNEGEK
ncbi:HpcH/HpaI aldolase family protein [Amycolatopsis sp.]|uniref:HpcH/HpaI aldolase family protein n=1 Tax=Amycolatopsis sp. TaxID=37632 RepID=UPI002BD05248|nr:aldolase/citrate lyase family protein [Amycolatopsis sp.]HVV10448.1 aldolase/citrate lyase family protein [Amycolatopsis sp.]